MSNVLKNEANADTVQPAPPGAVVAPVSDDGKPKADVPSSVPMPVENHPNAFRSLNDCLSIERTVLANERTLLAYVRSSLAVLVVAVTIIKFFTSQGMIILGYLLLVIGVVCITVGLMRFTEMHHRINDLGRCKDTKPGKK